MLQSSQAAPGFELGAPSGRLGGVEALRLRGLAAVLKAASAPTSHCVERALLARQGQHACVRVDAMRFGMHA